MYYAEMIQSECLQFVRVLTELNRVQLHLGKTNATLVHPERGVKREREEMFKDV